MAAVMIGVDPHKGSHTAVAIDAAEVPLGTLRVRASSAQAGKLLEWAAEWPERTWAVEGAGGLGHLLAQQLVAAGEQVMDVQPKLGARVRLLSTGTSNKNDPNDARSVAVAALRSPVCQQVRPDDHALILRVWSRRHRQLSRLRSQAACRLHAVCARSSRAASARKSPSPALPRSSEHTTPPMPWPRPGTTWPTST
jgi:transposase